MREKNSFVSFACYYIYMRGFIEGSDRSQQIERDKQSYHHYKNEKVMFKTKEKKNKRFL